MPTQATKEFSVVHRAEIEAIDARRLALAQENPDHARGPVQRRFGDGREVFAADDLSDATPFVDDTIGLSLSGGGIRSASFSLGAVQALHVHGMIDRIDYISAVSGGGYLASSLTAGMSAAGAFPFPARSPETGTLTDSLAVAHIRDHSKYLMPRGFPDLLASLAIMARGLFANLTVVLGPLLICVGITAWSNPRIYDLGKPDIFGWNVPYVWSWNGFAFTPLAVALGVAFLTAWAFARSLMNANGAAPEFTGFFARWATRLFVVIAVITFFEFQVFVIEQLYILTNGQQANGLAGAVAAFASKVAVFFGPLATVGAFLVRNLLDAVRQRAGARQWQTITTSVLSKAALIAVALSVPLLLWIAYLYLSLWAIERGGSAADALTWQEEISLRWYGIVFLATGALVSAASLVLSGNANSLHRLYRDRLAAAFLFAPDRGQRALDAVRPGESEHLEPADRLKLSAIQTTNAPFLILNTALNIEGSANVNRRGRNADFFMFSPVHVGSATTGWVATTAMEKAAPDLDLATAMAISGAAASSNMGSSTIRFLAPTLTILNIRLGYWLRNPARLGVLGRAKSLRDAPGLWLWAEMFSLLTERNRRVYLTDGGHIENLGLYELLRRRCKLIIVIDAEADKAMRFPSLITLERYARIDRGTRIDLKWDTIRAEALTTNASLDASEESGQPPPENHGPHVAIGRIIYGEECEGQLVYIKASLSGDEPDYVLDYRARNPDFPHETTGDQFFSEAQLEAYRALGFHIVDRFLRGADRPEPAGAMKEALNA